MAQTFPFPLLTPALANEYKPVEYRQGNRQKRNPNERANTSAPRGAAARWPPAALLLQHVLLLHRLLVHLMMTLRGLLRLLRCALGLLCGSLGLLLLLPGLHACLLIFFCSHSRLLSTAFYPTPPESSLA
jgi:hypothetical protein